MTGQSLHLFHKEILAIVAVLLPVIVSASPETLLTGDVYVEGVFSLYSTVNNTCVFDQLEPEFVQNMESIRWTLEQLNKDADINMHGTRIGEYEMDFRLTLFIPPLYLFKDGIWRPS